MLVLLLLMFMAPAQAAPPEGRIVGCDDVLIPLPDLHEVLPVDVTKGELQTPIPIPGEGLPAEIAISPDATKAYVVTELPDTVVAVDLSNGETSEPLVLGDEAIARGPVVSPDGTTLVLQGPSSLLVIDLTAWVLEAPIELERRPLGAAFTPDSATVFVGQGLKGTVIPIDMSTRQPGTPIAVGGETVMGPVSPDGSEAFAISALLNTVTPIDALDHSTGPRIQLAFAPGALTLSPDGRQALTATGIGVISIDLQTSTAAPAVPYGFEGGAVSQVFTPDGTRLAIVMVNPSAVVTFDVATSTYGTPIPLPAQAIGIAAIPADQAPTASLSVDDAPAGSATQFDASASTADCGGIRSYAWDFGDGSEPIETSTPTVGHVYARRGSYTATVTATSSAGTSTRQVYTGFATTNNGGPSAVAAVRVEVGPPAQQPMSVHPRFTG